MNKFEDVDEDALCGALGEASSAKTAKRLMTALDTRMASASKR